MLLCGEGSNGRLLDYAAVRDTKVTASFAAAEEPMGEVFGPRKLEEGTTEHKALRMEHGFLFAHLRRTEHRDAQFCAMTE
jgi:hypothetical protein